MQHDSNSNPQAKLFEKWLAGKSLTNVEMQQLSSEPHWQEQMRVVDAMRGAQTEMEAQPVPKWDIDSTFVNHAPASQFGFWHQNGMSLAAMTFSIVACCLLFLNMQNETNLAQQQQQMLTAQLESWSEKNREILTRTIDRLEQQQTDNSIKLANYLMENSRVERQEDLQQVVALIQSQREEDLRFVHAELSELQYQMKVAALASRNPNNLNSMANPPLPQMTDE